MIKRIYLPGAKVEIELVLHDFLQALYSLLSDPDLMREENLLLDLDNPYGLPPDDKSILGDINTGDRFHVLYFHYCTGNGRRVLCTIILFGDKTHTDRNGNLCMEPYSFTLGIFNRATRMRPDAWRILGYVKNQGALPQTSTPLERAKDYHLMLKEILSGLVQAQQHHGIEWNLELKGKKYPVVLCIPVHFVIGDNEGHDKMCGRYLASARASGCRCCDVRSADLGDSTYKGNFTLQTDIEKMVEEKDLEGLKFSSQHLLENAFYKIDVGLGNRGIHGCVPPDLLHSVQLGINMYVCKGLYLQKRLPQKKKKAKTMTDSQKNAQQATDQESGKCSSEEPYAKVYEALDAKEYSKLYVLGGEFLDKVDIWSRKYGRVLQHQSDRDLPRCSFSQSITTLSKLCAHEVQGIMIVLLIILCSYGGQEIEKRMGGDRHASYISLLEKLLMLEQFLKQDEFKRADVLKVKQYMPLLLDLFSRTVNRQEGNKDNFLKYHLPLHFCDNILEFGSPQNIDSGVGEHNHIFQIKNNAKKTQRRATTFDFQTGTRYTESVATDRCQQFLPHLYKTTLEKNTDLDGCVGLSQFKGSKRYVARHDGMFEITNAQLKEAIWSDDSLKERVLLLIQTHVLPCLDADAVELFTQCKRSGIIFKGHPGRRGLPAWQDWALFDWGIGDEIPGHIMVFVHLSDVTMPIHINGSVAEHPGYYAIVESLPAAIDPTDDDQRPVPQSELLLWGSKNPTDQPKAVPPLCLATVDSIVKPLVAVPYDVEGKHYPHDYIFMYERSSWPTRFVKRVRATLSGKEYAH